MRADHHASFTAYVLERRAHLVRTAYLLCGDPDDAEDLVQSALVKAAARWDRLEADPEAYVRRILVNEHISWWRRHRGRVRSVAAVPDVVDTGPDHDEALALRAALACLAPRQRAVVVLRFFVDLDVAATARALGCSEGTVKSQTSDALRRLRPVLRDHAGIPAPTGP